MKLKEIPEYLNCFGYFGLGGGWAVQRGYKVDSSDTTLCSKCKEANRCFEVHASRVKNAFPDASRDFEAVLDECGGDMTSARALFKSRFNWVDPVTEVMTANFSAGRLAAQGKDPNSGGMPQELKLQWPLVEPEL